MKSLWSQLDGNDVLVVLGLTLLGAGLAAYSWRLALGVIGGLLVLIGLAGAWRKGAR